MLRGFVEAGSTSRQIKEHIAGGDIDFGVQVIRDGRAAQVEADGTIVVTAQRDVDAGATYQPQYADYRPGENAGYTSQNALFTVGKDNVNLSLAGLIGPDKGEKKYSVEKAREIAAANGIDPSAPIYIGGGGDGYLPKSLVGAAVRDYVNEVEEGNFFTHFGQDFWGTSWSNAARAVEVMHSLDKPVIIIGHSYGGDSALHLAQYAKDRGIPVRLLVTVDPVDGRQHRHFATELAQLSKGLGGNWVNIRATSYEDKNIVPDASDNTARIGGRMSIEAQKSADKYFEAKVHHWEFGRMLTSKGVPKMISNVYERYGK